MIFSQHFRFSNFWGENFENVFLENIFQKDFRQDENVFLIQIFSTVWIMSLDFQQTVQSTRGSSSMPRQWIAF